MYDVKVANGKIVTSDAVFAADVLIKDGKIALVGSAPEEQAAETIDAAGKLIFPGMIDSHAHLNDPGFTWREDFPHGSAAAAAGGVTTLVDMPLQNEPALTSAVIFDAKTKAIAGRSYVDYCFWGGIIDNNLADLAGLNAAGVVSFKAFIGPVSPDYSTVNMGLVRDAMQILREFDGLGGFHCEDYSVIKGAEAEIARKKGSAAHWQDFLDSRPLSAELISTYSIIEMARETGARTLICHVSHPDVAELIRRAQAEGVRVHGETCSHYLTFSADDVVKNGSIFKCAPPLRSAQAREKLWEYVISGTLQCLGSDHSPCRADEKDEKTHGVLGAWGGISGIQSLLQVPYDQGVNKRGFCPSFLARAARDTARIFGIDDRKGALTPGLDADLVILDPEKEWEITADSLKYLNQISSFVGLRGKGMPVCTLVRGETVARNCEVVGSPHHGQLVKKGQQ